MKENIWENKNPYEIDAEVCRLKGLDYAQKHAWEVTQMIRAGCPSVEEAVKIIDQADHMHEIRERMQAIYDHLDAINDILRATETVKDIRDFLPLQVVREGKNVYDSGDFNDPADFI